MGYSSLAADYVRSKNSYGPRKYKITRITPHVFVGQVTAERAAEVFQTSHNTSANYVIGHDGKIICCIPEEEAAMTSSSSDNDHRAITIEVASDVNEPYAVTNEAFNSLCDLVADIASRYKMTVLPTMSLSAAAIADKSGKQISLTMHRWFKNKACPGQYLIDRWGQIASVANGSSSSTGVLYKVQVGAYKNRQNAERMKEELKSKGYDCFIVANP